MKPVYRMRATEAPLLVTEGNDEEAAGGVADGAYGSAGLRAETWHDPLTSEVADWSRPSIAGTGRPMTITANVL